jgi:hypothetical protein
MISAMRPADILIPTYIINLTSTLQPTVILKLSTYDGRGEEGEESSIFLEDPLFTLISLRQHCGRPPFLAKNVPFYSSLMRTFSEGRRDIEIFYNFFSAEFRSQVVLISALPLHKENFTGNNQL